MFAMIDRPGVVILPRRAPLAVPPERPANGLAEWPSFPQAEGATAQRASGLQTKQVS